MGATIGEILVSQGFQPTAEMRIEQEKREGQRQDRDARSRGMTTRVTLSVDGIELARGYGTDEYTAMRDAYGAFYSRNDWASFTDEQTSTYRIGR